MRSRIFLKLFLASTLAIVIAMLALDVAVRGAWSGSLRHEIERSLTDEVRLFAQRVQSSDGRSLPQIAVEVARDTHSRATIIDASGKVLADSEANPDTMENHATRPEIKQALANKIGTDTRWSRTVGVPFLYVAAPVPNGVVRLAYPIASVDQTTRQVRRSLFIASIFSILLALVMAWALARWMDRRLRSIVHFAEEVAKGNLAERNADHSKDEIGLVAAALDATARRIEQNFSDLRRSQAELETVLNSMQEGVIAFSGDGRVQWANRHMKSMMPRAIRVGSPATESVRDPDFLAAVQGVLEKRESRSARLTSVVPGRTYHAAVAPMPDGAVAVLYDLTAIERMEKTRRDFIANVSHELRTPLTCIQGYTETLLDNHEDGEHAREFLEIIRKNAMRMTRLTDDLLTLARVESREHRFGFRKVTAAQLLNDAEESFRDVARSAGVGIELQNGSRAEFPADPDALHQVFANLIDNAIKYAGSGKTVVLGASDHDTFVEFFVRDFGPGISSEHLPRLFERFYRVDKARSRESGGTGLGLAIAKHIVLAHSGTISAESELNHGSRFVFTLPLSHDDNT